MLKKIAAGLMAVSLIATPAIAQESADLARSSASVGQSEKFAGEPGLFAVIAVIGVIATVLLVTGDDFEDAPTSP